MNQDQIASKAKGVTLNDGIRIVDITDMNGVIMSPEWLAKSEFVHRQLRPLLPKYYGEKMKSVFTGGGRMSVAACGSDVTGVAVYRIYENTVDGLHMYVDDLVTDDTKRSTGIGRALMDHLQRLAREHGCDEFRLDSGTQRQQAHKFYFREGMVVTAFHFGKKIAKTIEKAGA
ncbi:MAG: GNAT family N-acetyltransferase [Proteobacteria bacterium]|nr:GNAT family N-acetyltransferase [Pseudomonadota bacterium]